MCVCVCASRIHTCFARVCVCRMANKASKGRVKKTALSKGACTAGPKKGFAKQHSSSKLQKKKNVEKRGHSAPLLMCVVPFHESVVAGLVSFVAQMGIEILSEQLLAGGEVTLVYAQKEGRKIQILVPLVREIVTVLDLAKVADVLVGVFPNEASFENSAFDALGYQLLGALRMQGLPSLVVGCPTGTANAQTKTVERYFVSEFGEKAKFILHAKNLVNVCTRAVLVEPISRRGRGYMLVESVERVDGLVVVSGYTRGMGAFSTETAVNLTGNPNTWRVVKIASGGAEMVPLRDISDALVPTRPAEEQEQTWPTAEEEAAAEQIFERKMQRVSVPKGVDSEMEAAWLGEVDLHDQGGVYLDEHVEDQVDNHVDDQVEEAYDDACSVNSEELLKAFDWDTKPTEVRPERFESRTREEMDFVDEMDTPEGTSARKRFAKYRGLKSLRNGNWDPYEELPIEYSQIFEFQDLHGAQKEGFLQMGVGCDVGQRISIWLAGPQGETSSANVESCLVASVVAPNESKVTVVHARVSRLVETAHIGLNSKQLLTVQCGFKRFEIRPIFSEIPKYTASSGTLPIQRMFRSVPEDVATGSVLMSFYAPAIFGPNNPVLVWSEESAMPILWGSVATCAPNRPLIVKRITLTGYPFRVHQTKAVIRFMFFDPTDIEWFKPVELSTKKGLRGHIIESLGTHGYMKCRFNGQLTSDDIVCMHLYKRVFPKWHPKAWTTQHSDDTPSTMCM